MTSHNKNTVRARVSVSFKGETHELDAVLDLDQCFSNQGEAPNFHQYLARASSIDPYSYLYDAMESHEIVFSEPTGAAALFCKDGVFDWSGFEQNRRAAVDWEVVKTIAQQSLALKELQERTELKQALLAVYQAGMARGLDKS